MLSSFSKFIVSLSIIIPLIFFGCKKETKPVLLHQPELKTTEQVTDISGEYFGYLKNVSLQNGSYFASIVFVEHQKKEEVLQKSGNKFADSLEVLELPNEYFFSVKGKSPEQFLIDPSAKIVMQTLNRDASGNYMFTEKVNRNKLYMLYTSSKGKQFAQIPFRFNLSHNTILSIEEKYLP